jgi:hypothetical protein
MRIEIIAGEPVMRFKVDKDDDGTRVLEEMRSYGITGARELTDKDREKFREIAKELDRRRLEE